MKKVIKGIGSGLIIIGVAMIFGTAGSSDLGIIAMPQIIVQGLAGIFMVINGVKILNA